MSKIFLILISILLAISCVSQNRYINETTKKVVFARDGGKCNCCGSYINLEFDHIMPFSCGGTSESSNIQLLCQKCNRSKSNSCYCKIHNKKVGINCCDIFKDKNNISQSVLKPQIKNSIKSTQCTGITKKGLRCRNMTTSFSGRCYLH